MISDGSFKSDNIPAFMTSHREVPAAGWTQWFLFIGLIEKGLYTYDPTRSPGDYENAGVRVVELWCGAVFFWR